MAKTVYLCGIGVNVNEEFDGSLQDIATSYLMEKGVYREPYSIALKILKELEHKWFCILQKYYQYYLQVSYFFQRYLQHLDL